MKLNFLKWQEGTADFKQGLGLMLLLFAVSLFLIWRRGRGQAEKRLAISGGILALAVFMPVTAVALLIGYTGFYDWTDLQLLIPFIPVLALGGCLAVEETADGKIPAAVAYACVIFLLLAAANFHAFDGQEESDGYGIPSGACAVFDSLQEMLGEGEATILADSDLLQYVRLYNADWYPAYGRDLWDSHAAGYVEYTYDAETTEICEILAQASPTQEDIDTLISFVKEAQLDCLIVPWYWEAEIEDLSDYNLVTLTEQYIGYVKMDD